MQATINQMEAGAFYTHAAMRCLSSAEALAELDVTHWPDNMEDSAFGRRRHTPTIKRLAKPLIARLDAQHERARLDREARDVDTARWLALTPEQRAEVRAIVSAPPSNTSNKRIRAQVAADFGLTWWTADMDRLRRLMASDGRW